jgi:hypothetical protein
VQAVPLQQAVKGPSAHAQQPRGARLVATDELERANDVFPFDFEERRWDGGFQVCRRPHICHGSAQALAEGINCGLDALVAGG